MRPSSACSGHTTRNSKIPNMYQVSEEAKKQLYETFGRTEKIMEDDVNIIKDWMKTQPHLPEMMEDVKIKNFLNLNKFSIEKTKQKIDMYYSIRGIIPEIFSKSNPKNEQLQKFFETTYVSTFPKLLNKTHRVYVTKQKLPNSLQPVELCCIWFAIFEIRLYEDFMVDDVIIADMSNNTLNDYRKVTPTLLAKFFSAYKKVYGLRVKKLIYINCPSYISTFVAILKTVLKPKIFDRAEFHSNDDVLRDIIPKDSLPKEYGGDGPSLDELNEMLRGKLEEYQDRFDLLDTLKVNEDLRPEKLDNDEVLGFYGSFKKIGVD